jgi:hypothetical protein
MCCQIGDPLTTDRVLLLKVIFGIFKRYNAKATFFLIREQAEKMSDPKLNGKLMKTMKLAII